MAKWGNILSRGNVEDRRSLGPTRKAGRLGIAGIAIVLLINYLGTGKIDVVDVLTQLQNTQVNQQQIDPQAFTSADNYEVFVSTVLGSTNDMWTTLFAQNNQVYVPPKLVLFRGSTESACNGATSAVGPHYCPIDKTIYLDETFFEELINRLGATGGDVAEAYVIAHEVGHHVQNQLQSLDSEDRADNTVSIKTELQADCYAGLWAYSIKNAGIFEPGEIQEAMDAAAAVGDDRIQKVTTGSVSPESWTHGSSTDRMHWFNQGYEQGTPTSCDTFSQ